MKFTVKSTDGSTTTHTFSDVCLPAGATQRAYVSFHIPDTPGAMVVDITTSSNITPDVTKIQANVVELVENTPPDPKGTDRNDSFTESSLPGFSSATQHSWTTYTCNKVGDVWEYQEIPHSIVLTPSMSIQADEQVPTAEGEEIKSGYGINVNVLTRMSGNGTGDIIAPQTVISYYPEFGYQDYWRILEPSNRTQTQASFHLKENPYSIVKNRVHFLPVWYPDGVYLL